MAHEGLVLSYGDVECFMVQISGMLCPLDLMVLKKVSKAFRKYIDRHFPDFGIERNFFKIDSLTEPRHVKQALDDGLFLFGSYLLKVVTTNFQDQVTDFHSDIDLFFSVESLPSRSKRFDVLFPEKTFFSLVQENNDNLWYSADDVYATLHPFKLVKCGLFDVPVGILKQGESPKQCAIAHIGRSDLPLQRMFFSRSSGFQMQKFSDFFGPQTIPVPELPILSDMPYVCDRMSKFVRKFPRFSIRILVHPDTKFSTVQGLIQSLPKNQTKMVIEKNQLSLWLES